MNTTPEAKAVTLAETPAPPAPITPMEMLQRAVDANADLEQLERLMDLQERWEKTQAKKAYTVALAQFKVDPPSVIKNKRAGFESRRTGDKTEYEYATLAHVVAVVAPSLSEHGLSHSWSLAQSDTAISVTCTLTHEGGHSESVTLSGPPDTSGSKNSIQAISSTVSYLERYTFLAITGLAASDMDDDGGKEVEKITADDVVELETRIADVKADQAKFLAWLGVDKLEDLPADRMTDARNALEKKRTAE